MSTIFPDFEDRIIAIHGQTGQNWLSSLAALQENLALRWSLTDLQPVQDLSYHYLAYANSKTNNPVVLKLGVPHPELESEIEALREYEGIGSVRLLDADPSLGAMLLERILPGDHLLSLQDDRKATRIAATVMNNLWKPAPFEYPFPTAGMWSQGFQRYLDKFPTNGPLPADFVDIAANLAKDLLGSQQNQFLLHGDLHHQNILLGANKDWVAIDPQGVIGEAAFEVGPLLLNPVPDLIHWPDLREVLEQRLKILQESLSLEQERLSSWSFVRAVLSSIWSLEDGEDWKYGIKIAEILSGLI